jgi:cold shock protein
MATGKVKFFNRKKGYGFIVEDESEKEFFVHVSGLAGRELEKGEEVIFDIAEDERGQKAINVQKKVTL